MLEVHWHSNLPSDHASVSISFNCANLYKYLSIEELKKKATMLGHAFGNLCERHLLCKWLVKSQNISPHQPEGAISTTDPPALNLQNGYVDLVLKEINALLFDAIKQVQPLEASPQPSLGNETHNWWQMLNNNDHKGIRHVIDWNSEVEAHGDKNSDELFKEQVEKLLNPTDPAENRKELPCIMELVYIPLTYSYREECKPQWSTPRYFYISSI